MKRIKGFSILILVVMLISLPLISNDVHAGSTHVDLNNAELFAVLAGSGITNAGATTITGDVGSSPTSTETGFAGLVTFLDGTNHTAADPNDAATQNAKTSLAAAYLDAAGQGPQISIVSDLGSMTPLSPGVYHSATTITLTGTLTLDGGGDPNAVFVFQAGTTLTTASGSKIILTNGTQACNVYWQVGSSATLGTGSLFVGNILAAVSITDSGGSTINGRLLAQSGAVTLNNTTITRPFCVPSISKSFSPANITTDGISTLTITFGNMNATDATLTSPFTDNLPTGVVLAITPNLSTTCGGSGAFTANPGGSSFTMPAGRSIPGNGNCTVSLNVTTSSVGCSINTIPIGALETFDGNNNVSVSATLCATSAVFADTTISTSLSSGSIAVGGSMNDGATLSGTNIGTAAGSVTYVVYTDNACTLNAQAAGTKPVTGGIVPDSNSILFTSAGTYYWQAVYSGATGFNPSTSTCSDEVLTVNKVSPTMTTTLSSASILAGDSVHDGAILSGMTSSAIGTVTYTIYSDNACTLNPQNAGIKTVSSGVVPNSNDLTFNSTGTYYWQAVYSGDSNNTGVASACTDEALTVNKVSPTMATKLSSTTISAGGSVHDGAILSGMTGNASGTVTYTVYTDNACTLNARGAGIKTVTSGIVPDSNALSFNSTGTYYWQAVYSGDSNNNGVTSTCTDEALTVNKVSPTIATTLSSTTISAGGSVRDGAILSGMTFNAGGTVIYTVYTDSSCTLNPQNAGTKTVTAGIVPNSNDITFNSTGTYFWQAVYSGDSNNNGVTSACTDEVLTVNKVSPAITTALSFSSINVGESAFDTLLLHGATSNASGTVTYTVYSDSSCSLNAQNAGVKTVTGGVVPNSNSITFNTAGNYYWHAVYSGDSNNDGVSSTCGSKVLTVNDVTSTSATPAAGLPNSGFAPYQITVLSIQSSDKDYAGMGDLWLEIPSLNVRIPIVGVPQQADGSWDISWLGSRAGWLNGTAFPTALGNSVLTGHVYDADGNPGPFVGLYGLSWGDEIIIHNRGKEYVYEVWQVTEVDPLATSRVLKHEDQSYITLLTCRGFDAASNSYKYRVMIRAVLVEVK